jgi:hypothetical protein
MLFWVDNDIFLWMFILANKLKKTMFFFLITISGGTPSDISRNPGWETLA